MIKLATKDKKNDDLLDAMDMVIDKKSKDTPEEFLRAVMFAFPLRTLNKVIKHIRQTRKRGER